MAKRIYSLIVRCNGQEKWEHRGEFKSVKAAIQAGNRYSDGFDLRVNADGHGVAERQVGSYTWRRF